MTLLLCAFGAPSGVLKAPGWDGPDHCRGCYEETERGITSFAEDVKAGKFDAFGYTPSEAKHRKPTQFAFRMENA